MRGVIRVDSGGRRGVKEETRKRTSVAIGNRTGSKGEIRSKSLISRHIRGISKFPQEWTLGEIWVGELSSRGIATVRLGRRKIKSAKDYEVRALVRVWLVLERQNDWWMAYCTTNLLPPPTFRWGKGRRNRVWNPCTPNDLLSFLPSRCIFNVTLNSDEDSFHVVPDPTATRVTSWIPMTAEAIVVSRKTRFRKIF